MPTLVLPTEKITDWLSFHAECAQLFGFPTFYGKNMNAWIDCLSYLDEEDGMSNVKLQPGENLSLHIPEFKTFATNYPDICSALLECTSFVNERYVRANEAFRIVLVLE